MTAKRLKEIMNDTYARLQRTCAITGKTFTIKEVFSILAGDIMNEIKNEKLSSQ